MSDPTHQNPGPQAPGGQSDGPIFSLCELDGRALDALLTAKAAGIDRGPVPAGLGERSEKVGALLALLDQAPVQDPPGDLTARTLAAIRAHEQRQRFSQQVRMLAEPRRTLGISWQQLVTVAAVFIIGTSLLIPVIQRQRADSRRMAGAANLGMTGQAMGSYAADNLGQMPRGEVRPGMPWWEVGQSQANPKRAGHSNSANLYRLVWQDYIPPAKLTCPENAFTDTAHLTRTQHDWAGPLAVPFSYQNQYAIRVPRLNEAPNMAVVADRNPLFEVYRGRIIYDATTPLNAPSRAHHGTGQNVLTANGAVAWRIHPYVDPTGPDDQDNFWTTDGVDVYTGRETPADPLDSFLVP